MKKIIVVFFILISSTSIVYADCVYNGQSYPTGSVVNGYICKPDGTWGQ